MRLGPCPARAAVCVPLVALLALAGCRDEPERPSGPEPMRPAKHPPAEAPPPAPPLAAEPPPVATDEVSGKALPERPRADPDIERALDLIGASGLRFVDRPSEPDGRASEYTAEQFAAMLRTKWDWIGYDLTELSPWLDGVATRSFKTNLAYQVVLADGTTTDLRPWLDAQLAAPVEPRE